MTSIIYLCSKNGTWIIYIVGIPQFAKCHEIGDLNFGGKIHLFYTTRILHTLLNIIIRLGSTCVDFLPRYEVPLCNVSEAVIPAWNSISPSFRHVVPMEYRTSTTNAIFLPSVQNPIHVARNKKFRFWLAIWRKAKFASDIVKRFHNLSGHLNHSR